MIFCKDCSHVQVNHFSGLQSYFCKKTKEDYTITTPITSFNTHRISSCEDVNKNNNCENYEAKVVIKVLEKLRGIV